MDIEHRPGRSHGNADGVSRIPCKQCGKFDNENSQKFYQIEQMDNSEVNPLSNLLEIQNEDRDIKLVKQWLDSEERPSFRAISSESWFLKSLLNQWSRLSLQQGLLVRRWDNLETGQIIWQAVVPLCLRREALKYAHDIKAAAHLGIKKTLGKISQKYYWPGLQNDVKIYVGGCEQCSRKKNPNPTKTAHMQIVRSGFPMERIAMDILGELPVTERGNKYVLVISDYFTKWTESFAMPNMEAKTCAKILVEEVIARFGVPNKIHSDQGRQFESRLFAEMCEMLQIEKTRTTPYHPQSDGMVERFNRTLCTMLSTLIGENQRNWDTLLPYVMMAYRSTAHETVGMSPNALMLGRETSTPLDLQFEMPLHMKKSNENDWVWELKENLETSHNYVRELTGLTMYRQKRYHDQKISYEQFAPDDAVYVYFPVVKVGQSAKLSSFWKGPYTIQSKLSDVLYKLNCGRNKASQIVHVDRLKRSKYQRLTGEAESEQMSSQSVDQTEREVSPSVIEEEEEVVEEAEEEEEEEDIMQNGPVSYSRFGRQRRRPVWLNDYVSCLFSNKTNMPPTKTTPRKHPVDSIICPVCRDDIRGQNFNSHIVKCAESRHKCQTCAKTFKKAEYLKQHMKRKHHMPELDAVATDLSVSSLSSSSDDEDKDDSDWNSDPKVELDEEQSGENQSRMEDKRNVRDISTGRIIRKPCKPAPVFTPVKRRKVEETKGSGLIKDNTVENNKVEIVQRDTVENNKVEIVQRDPVAQSENSISVAAYEPNQENKTEGGQIKLKFIVKGRRVSDSDMKIVQAMHVEQNAEMLIDSSIVHTGQMNMGNMKLNLADFTRATIKPENINIDVKQGELLLDIKYQK